VNDAELSVLMLTRHAVTEPARFAAWLGALVESAPTTPTHWKIGSKKPAAFDREAVQATVAEHRTTGRIDVIYLFRKRPPKFEVSFSCPDAGLRYVLVGFNGVPAAGHLPDVFAAADHLAAALAPEFGYADFPWGGREYGPLYPGVMTWKTLNQLGPALGYRRTYLGPHVRRLASGTIAAPRGTTATDLGDVLRVDLLAPPWAGTAAELTAARAALTEANDPPGVFRRRGAKGAATPGPAWVPVPK